jgi:hypothetical protein
MAKFGNPQYAPKIIITGLAGAITFHALFNYFLMDSWGFALLLLILIPFLWWLVHRNLRDTLDKSGFK